MNAFTVSPRTVSPREDGRIDPRAPRAPGLWVFIMGATLVAGGIALAAGLLFVLATAVDTLLGMRADAVGLLAVLLALATIAVIGLVRLARSPGRGQMPRFN